jgi:hypothetical protein
MFAKIEKQFEKNQIESQWGLQWSSDLKHAIMMMIICLWQQKEKKHTPTQKNQNKKL